MNTALLKSLGIDLSYELSDFLESGHSDVSDYAHEQADSSADVIYYAKAEELYNSASPKERYNAEDMVEGMGGFGGDVKTMAERFTVLAYWILRERVESQLREELEELEDSISDKITELETLRDSIDY